MFLTSLSLSSSDSLNINLFSLSYGNKIDIINCQLGKSISSFYGSETKIKSLFSNPNNNFLLCDSEEGILNILKIYYISILMKINYLYKNGSSYTKRNNQI